MASERKKILVTGATGKQGRAFIESLRNSGSELSPSFRVLALTRNPQNAAANSVLAGSFLDGSEEPHLEVEVVQGNLDDEASVRKVFEGAGGKASIWGVFMVLAFPGLGVNADGEERQGILLSNLALEYGVSHFVFSSIERGGEALDDTFKLDRGAKVKIERHIRGLGEKGLKWTILRPSFFMENFGGPIGKITTTVLRCGLKPDTKLQLCAANDIGKVASAVFQNPHANEFKVITITSDSLTTTDQDSAYFKATGKHQPSIPNFLGRLLISMNSATKELISEIERVHSLRLEDSEGYEAHLDTLKATNVKMTLFEGWARDKGAQKKNEEKWNQVSVGKLFTGRS